MKNITFKFLGKILFSIIAYTIVGCSNKEVKKDITESNKLFTIVPKAKTNINFKNIVEENSRFICFNYPYIYNGGGVAVGDVNNDGLQDIYFVSNQRSNKLYINKGNFEFSDVTNNAKVADNQGWSTGVTMIDINNDGWLDIYVCKSASPNPNFRKNKLFVNQKDGTFNDEAQKWGLDHSGFSTQAYFFDYDKDGDLDMYLVNHRQDFENSNRIEDKKNREYSPEISDHLFRNEGDKFTNVTLESGVKNKEWGLSASIGDFNNDGWLDIYVACDYILPDYLYINNRDGTFSNKSKESFKHISFNSMGSDFADINNDFLPDLLVLDMSAADHSRGKQNMPSMNTKGFKKTLEKGYNYSYMSNVLQLNNGNGTFTDIAQVSGISQTDWSWSPLIVDLDNDGFKDVFITNGIERELGNQDYRRILNEKHNAKEFMSLQDALNTMPSEKLSNFAFKNNGDLSFSKVSKDWGLDKRVNTNGVAYADFDNDGDLDLVLNNLSDEAIIYQNNSTKNYIKIKLVGDEKNTNAIGAKIKVYSKEKKQYQELFTSRGYHSSVASILNFGLGDEKKITKIEVIWGDNSISVVENIDANQTIIMAKEEAKLIDETKEIIIQNFVKINPKDLGISYEHVENEYNDFERQVLLPQKQSQQGPSISVIDINNDGLEDFFVGGALNQPAQMYLQNNKGKFTLVNQQLFKKEKRFEDNGAHFFDADQDGDLDLYVSSGGYELEENSPLLEDRLYLNEGNAVFVKSNKLPKLLTNTKTIKSNDIDGDGDMDLVIAGHVVPGKYPVASQSYILQNSGGTFKNVTMDLAPEFSNIGIVNDIIFSDYDKDGDKDLVVVGEWMPITIFKNNNGKFIKVNIPEFKNTNGWWNTVKQVDFDDDGDMDYFIGNLGKNNKFHPSTKKPLHIYGNNFDSNDSYDMILSKIYKGNLVPTRGKECSTQQNAFVSEKMASYKDFANASLIDIYGESLINTSYHKEVFTFSSVYVQNNGNGTFTIKELPISAQLGPTMAFEIVDINKDGIKDVIGVGGIFEAEIETIRYDSNTGYLLLGNKNKNDLIPYSDINFFDRENAKNMLKISVAERTYFFIANNNALLTIFELK